MVDFVLISFLSHIDELSSVKSIESVQEFLYVRLALLYGPLILGKALTSM